MRRLLPLLAVMAALQPGTASADVVPEAPGESVLGVAADGRPYVAYARFGSVFVARRDLLGWRGVFGSPRLPPGDPVVRAVLPDVRIGQRYTGIAVLVQDRAGGWASVVVRPRVQARPLVLTLARGARTQVGPAGVALDAAGRLIAAYSIRLRNNETELWVARLATNRNGTVRLTRTRITRRGFPPSSVPPAAVPLVARDGTLYVVQTWTERGATAIVWRRQRERWWGRVLFANRLGQTVGPVFARGEIPNVFATFAVAFATFGETHLVLAVHEPGSRLPTWSRVLHRRATPVALVREGMVEIAANEPVADLTAGLLLFEAGGSDNIGTLTVELDGRVRDYVAHGLGRHLLLERPDRTVEWFFSPAVPAAEITLEIAETLRGRVGPLTSGTVRIYREMSNQPRELVAEVPIAPDGTFSAPGVPIVPGSYYRAVWTDPRTGIPWAHLTRRPAG